MKKRIHNIPIGDIDIHAAQTICWCKPLLQDNGVCTHNAKDCRERIERQTGQKCSEGWILILEFYGH